MSWRARLPLLPRRVRLLVLMLLTCAAAPAAAGVYAAFGGTPLAVVLRAHPAALAFSTLLVASVVVVAYERPRSGWPVAYAQQLRGRTREVQSTFDGALRRQEGEGEEKSHAVRDSLDPNG